MAIITIEHQIGCGGRTIGQALAERLQLGYIDREIVRGVARELQVSEEDADIHDEQTEGLMGRILTAFGLSGELMWMMPPPESSALFIDDETYHRAACAVVEAAGRRDNVLIMGHGAAFVLADHPHALHINLYAPLPQRIEQVMVREHLSKDAARQRITQRDQDRAEFFRRFYHTDWHDPNHYHLMLNTATLSPEKTVDLIATLWRERFFG